MQIHPKINSEYGRLQTVMVGIARDMGQNHHYMIVTTQEVEKALYWERFHRLKIVFYR